jgi:2-(1,2-epoxy-1,2-dihydrophenyl)acetyl-CoA isomerase
MSESKIMTNTDSILLHRDGGIVTLTLNRPDKLNAFDPPMRLALAAHIQQLGADPTVGAIILTGAGRGFCSGADLAFVETLKNAPPPWQVPAGQDLLPAIIQRCPKIVICAINGVAAGAGLSIALACDIRIASTAASFAFVFVPRGINPDYGISYQLARSVGPQRALDLLTRDGKVSAEEALLLGLVLETVPPEELAARAIAWATRMAKLPSVALSIAKHTVHAAMTLTLEQTATLEAWGNSETDKHL